MRFGTAYGSMGIGFAEQRAAAARGGGVVLPPCSPDRARSSGHPLALGLAYLGLALPHAAWRRRRWRGRRLLRKGDLCVPAERRCLAMVVAGRATGLSCSAIWARPSRPCVWRRRSCRPGEEGGDAVIRIDRAPAAWLCSHAGGRSGYGPNRHFARPSSLESASRTTSTSCAHRGSLRRRSCTRGRVDEATGLLEEAAALTARHQVRTFYATQARISLADAYLSSAEAGDGAAMRSARSAVKRCMQPGSDRRRGQGRRHSESRARCYG